MLKTCMSALNLTRMNIQMLRNKVCCNMLPATFDIRINIRIFFLIFFFNKFQYIFVSLKSYFVYTPVNTVSPTQPTATANRTALSIRQVQQSL